ncbi:197_t:CDS:1, partial [Gigaspora margarita]
HNTRTYYNFIGSKNGSTKDINNVCNNLNSLFTSLEISMIKNLQNFCYQLSLPFSRP